MAINFCGIIKYDIHPGGCLTGIFTNTEKGNDRCEFYPEFAKKNALENSIEGIYDCTYQSTTARVQNNCFLEIKIDELTDSIFHFRWRNEENGYPFYTGIGMKLDEKSIVVAYRNN